MGCASLQKRLHHLRPQAYIFLQKSSFIARCFTLELATRSIRICDQGITLKFQMNTAFDCTVQEFNELCPVSSEQDVFYLYRSLQMKSLIAVSLCFLFSDLTLMYSNHVLNDKFEVSNYRIVNMKKQTRLFYIDLCSLKNIKVLIHMASVEIKLIIIDIQGVCFCILGLLNSAYSHTIYWTGANDRDQSKGWQWSDGSPFFYWNWNEGWLLLLFCSLLLLHETNRF